MGVSLEGKLVVAISSRALFDFEEENRLFETGDDRAYMKMQLDRLDQPAAPGVAFSLVHKLLAFNDAQAQRVEVVILSRNDPVSGMRVFRSPSTTACRSSAAASRAASRPGATCARCAPTCFSPPTWPTCAPPSRPACPLRRCTPHRCAPAARTPTRCASPSTATPCSSATRPSASTRPQGLSPSRARGEQGRAAAGPRPLQAAAGSLAPPAERGHGQ
jgi:hypothetical protein